MSPCLQRKPAALTLDTRLAPAAEGELGMRGDEWGDALEDAQWTRLQALVELGVDRIGDQCCAAQETGQELCAETPAEWIHR